MKKLLLSVLAIFTMAGIICGLAEELDFSNYDDNEIVTLLEQVQQEIVDRKIDKTATLHIGEYTGGKDIPIGTYILHCITDDMQFGGISLTSGTNSENTMQRRKLHEYISKNENQEFVINVEENDILHIEVSCELSIYTGIVFK